MAIGGLLPEPKINLWVTKDVENSERPFQHGSFNATGTIKVRISVKIFSSVRFDSTVL